MKVKAKGEQGGFDHLYGELIQHKTKEILKLFSNQKLKKEETAFLGLVRAVQRKARVSNQLLKSITQADLDKFHDQLKGIYFEGIALNLANENRLSAAVATLCRNALLHWEKAYFARQQLALLECKKHPEKGIELFEELLKYYPNDAETFFTLTRLHIRLHHRNEVLRILQNSNDKFRRGLYRIIMDMFANWAMYTMMFVLLILLVYTPIVSLIFYTVAGFICVCLMFYAIAKRDGFIFNFFFSTILIITVLIVVKWLVLK
jgi:tetratricopeptide (TPR) repeat protein